LAPNVNGQVADSTNFSIYYSSPQKLTIAGVDIAGIRYLDHDVLVQLSGLLWVKKLMYPVKTLRHSHPEILGTGTVF
jgi:outer membrane protein insertion porin family